jgi:hypothetical protein
LLADFNDRTRYPGNLADDEIIEAVEAVFRYLETHRADKTIAMFRPELGFTHVTLSTRADKQGPWLLIEVADRVLPSGGLNLHWNASARTVDQIEHWGTTRNLSP